MRVGREFWPGVEETEVLCCSGVGVGVHYGELWGKLDGEVGEEAKGVDVEEWNRALLTGGGYGV